MVINRNAVIDTRHINEIKIERYHDDLDTFFRNASSYVK